MYASEIIKIYFENGKIDNIELRNEPLYEILGHNYRFGLTEKLMNDLILVYQYFQLYCKRSDWDASPCWKEDKYGLWFEILGEKESPREFLRLILDKYDEFKKDTYFKDGILDEEKIASFRTFWRNEFNMNITKRKTVKLLVKDLPNSWFMNDGKDIIENKIWYHSEDIIKITLRQIMRNWDDRRCHIFEEEGIDEEGCIDEKGDIDERNEEFIHKFEDYVTSYPDELVPGFIKLLEKKKPNWELIEFLKLLMKYTGSKFISEILRNRLEFSAKK